MLRVSKVNGHGRQRKRAVIKKTSRRLQTATLSHESPPPVPERIDDWLLWQLADSAFPTGGFAHSLGLEAAWQHGEVRNRTELVSFIEAGLQQLGHAALPLVTAAFD